MHVQDNGSSRSNGQKVDKNVVSVCKSRIAVAQEAPIDNKNINFLIRLLKKTPLAMKQI